MVGIVKKTEGEYEHYLKSDCWRCSESPTGAHHWIRIEYDYGYTAIFLCKWCLEPREFPVIFSTKSLQGDPY